jgi:hypothetical protein
MKTTELVELASQLAEKYLPKERADVVVRELEVAIAAKNFSYGKEFLAILAQERTRDFSTEDAKKLKDIAYNLGL